MTAPDLKPCWHCGGEASPDGYVFYSKPCTETRWEDGSPITEAFFCNCPKCGVTNMTSGMGHRTRQQAIDHWNTRTTLLAEALAVPTEAILQALADHNDLLRSAAAIAGRGVLDGDGIVATANWDAFYNRVKVVLKRHHETTNAARAALRAIGEGRA